MQIEQFPSKVVEYKPPNCISSRFERVFSSAQGLLDCVTFCDQFGSLQSRITEIIQDLDPFIQKYEKKNVVLATNFSGTSRSASKSIDSLSKNARFLIECPELRHPHFKNESFKEQFLIDNLTRATDLVERVYTTVKELEVVSLRLRRACTLINLKPTRNNLAWWIAFKLTLVVSSSDQVSQTYSGQAYKDVGKMNDLAKLGYYFDQFLTTSQELNDLVACTDKRFVIEEFTDLSSDSIPL